MGEKSQVESALRHAGTVFPGKAVTHCIHYSCYSNTRGETSTFGNGGESRAANPASRNFPKCTRERSPKCCLFDGKKKRHTNTLTYKAGQPQRSKLFVLIYLHVPGPDYK